MRVKELLDELVAAAGISNPDGVPAHIAAKILGHASIATTQTYIAVYDQDVIDHHRAFIARRRKLRPSEEYREPTDSEWDEFLGHPVDCTTSRSMTGLDARSGGRTRCGRGHAAGAGRRATICPGGGSGGPGRVRRRPATPCLRRPPRTRTSESMRVR
jgi:hypothetical protein